MGRAVSGDRMKTADRVCTWGIPELIWEVFGSGSTRQKGQNILHNCKDIKFSDTDKYQVMKILSGAWNIPARTTK